MKIYIPLKIELKAILKIENKSQKIYYKKLHPKTLFKETRMGMGSLFVRMT